MHRGIRGACLSSLLFLCLSHPAWLLGQQGSPPAGGANTAQAQAPKEIPLIAGKITVDGRELYTANITQGGAIFHLNARTYVRATVQYVDYGYNAANYTFPVDPEYKHFFSQLLFSYKLNPRTVLFLGYTDNARGNQDYRLTRSDRTVFLKVSYSWQI